MPKRLLRWPRADVEVGVAIRIVCLGPLAALVRAGKGLLGVLGALLRPLQQHDVCRHVCSAPGVSSTAPVGTRSAALGYAPTPLPLGGAPLVCDAGSASRNAQGTLSGRFRA